MIKIEDLWMTQRNLKRAHQIPKLVEIINEGTEVLEKVIVIQQGEGLYCVGDGHHRIAAYWLAGRRQLDRYDYLLLQQPTYTKVLCGKIQDLLECLAR